MIVFDRKLTKEEKLASIKKQHDERIQRLNASQAFGIGNLLNGHRGHPDDVQSWMLFNEDSQRSTVSTVGRAVVGGAILGVAGAVIGGMTGKDKSTYIVKVEFSDCSGIFELNDSQFQKMMKRYGDKMAV